MKRKHKLFILSLLLVLLLKIGFSWQIAIAKPTPTNQQPEKISQTEATPTETETETETKVDTEAEDSYETLLEADFLYQQGEREAAEELYRKVKTPFASHQNTMFSDPINNTENLPTEIQTEWEEAKNAADKNDNLEMLQEFVAQHPEFVPGHLFLAKTLQKNEKKKEALQVLEKASSIFPDSVEIVEAHVKALRKEKDYLEASIAARQFVLVNPEHPEAARFLEIADENFEKFQKKIKGQMVGKGILGTAIRVGGCAVLGNCNVLGTVLGEGIKMGSLLLQGESGLGSRVAEAYKKQLSLVEDEEVVEYVSKIGNSIAELMGRDDFEYEFYVVKDDSLNAFALPGGKVFVNTGSILNTNSEAELAGLLTHEVAHAVLSHGFQRVVTTNLYDSAGGVVRDALKTNIPISSIATSLISLRYSRSNERQADIVGTRVLATAGYAADGLRNFMATLDEKKGGKRSLGFLSSHPQSDDRVDYLEQLIEYNGYNRYAFEGVEKHRGIQEKLM
ncbi:M48 family metalloprotease [Okeania sp.]|uniref:M48 family metalloprotease n=1 Tax=Okeania sp. TaxID=3100323 RepID=UPI002B4B4884|nr:M48 family metalloprotease [Okeania sp.]MEB3342841.1 M48 family metalloprotease [Okeania sp.]